MRIKHEIYFKRKRGAESGVPGDTHICNPYGVQTNFCVVKLPSLFLLLFFTLCIAMVHSEKILLQSV